VCAGMATPPVAGPQRVCPHCGTVAATTSDRCPFCRRGYVRHVLPQIAAMLLVAVAVTLGGVYAMLTAFGAALEEELDDQVRVVQRDLDRDVRRLQRTVREELDRRFPQTAGPR